MAGQAIGSSAEGSTRSKPTLYLLLGWWEISWIGTVNGGKASLLEIGPNSWE